MKKLFIPCLLGLCMIFSATAVKAAMLPNDAAIEILKFQYKAAISDEIAWAKTDAASPISDFVALVFKKTNRTKGFKILDNENLEAIANGHSYNQDGMVDPTNAPRIGRQKSTRYYISGSLTGLSAKSSGAIIDADKVVNLDGNKRAVVAHVVIKVIDAETRETLYVVEGEGISSRADAKLTLNVRGEEVYETITEGDDGVQTPVEATETNTHSYSIKIGNTGGFSAVQVHNAVKKAVADAIRNKKYGLIAELDGTAKEGKF